MNKRQKILIADDAKFNRDILKEFLGETYDYLEAENGNQVIQMIGENIGIDLMLLDINMPQMNGFEVLEIMKRSQCIAETPVIITSLCSNSKALWYRHTKPCHLCQISSLSS